MAEPDPTNKSQDPERGRDPVDEALDLFERRLKQIRENPLEEFKLMEEEPIIKAAIWAAETANAYRHLYEGALKTIERYRENCARNAVYEMEHMNEEARHGQQRDA